MKYEPQLATLAKQPPAGDAWLHEIKYDGYRMGCAIAPDVVRLTSRNGLDYTSALPELVADARLLPVTSALLDGEVVVLLEDGRASFQALQQAMSDRKARAGLVYLVFAPFPWSVSGLRQALVLPETLVWYALMPAFVRGLSFGLRRHFRTILPIVVFAVSLTLAYALMQGNIGTAYRQRTQITMFFFIFMAVGVVEKRRQRALRLEAAPIPLAVSRQS